MVTTKKYFRECDETLVMIRSDNSFVVVGEGNVSDDQILSMVAGSIVVGFELI